MKKVEELEAKMKALEAELRIEEEKECREIEKECQWVVGKCLNLRDGALLKIIGIEKSSDSSALQLECILVYYNSEHLKSTKIETYDEYVLSTNLKEYIEKYSISIGEFDAFFYKAVEALRGL